MQSFKNMGEFYSDNSARRRSPEADYGVHWKLDGWPNSWRVSYVRDTGEIYAVHQGPIQTGILPTGEIIIANGLEEGPVLLLGHFPWLTSDLEEAGPPTIKSRVYYRGLEHHLEGWPERCIQPNGLVWVIEKLGGSAPSIPHPFGFRDEYDQDEPQVHPGV